MNVLDLTLPWNPQHSINQRALLPVIENEHDSLLQVINTAQFVDDELHLFPRQGAELHTYTASPGQRSLEERAKRGCYRLRECKRGHLKSADSSCSHHAIILHTWPGNQLPQWFRVGSSAPILTGLLQHREANSSHLQGPYYSKYSFVWNLQSATLSMFLNTPSWFHFKLLPHSVSFNLLHKARRNEFLKDIRVITEKLLNFNT